MPKNRPLVSGGSYAEDVDVDSGDPDSSYYRVVYDYSVPAGLGGPTDTILNDIESRFKTPAYVSQFSETLIKDRIDKINNLIGVSIEREADTKIQKNKPLSYLSSTAIAGSGLEGIEEYIENDETSGTSFGPRSRGSSESIY